MHSIDFVKFQNQLDFDDYRYAGKITADCLSILETFVREKTVMSLKELDSFAEEYFISHNTIPVFKGLYNFPATVCMSVDNNKQHQLVHSIPTDYKLQDGDLITFDTGCKYKNGMADSALTCIYGKLKSEKDEDLISSTQECLYSAIKEISIGKQVGTIGNTIFHIARKRGYKVIEKYCGHGISRNEIHSSPTILNKAEINQGIRIQSGMVMAIEPLLTTGSTDTKVCSNNWTVITENTNAHFEHSILVLNDGVEVITHRFNEKIQKIINFKDN